MPFKYVKTSLEKDGLEMQNLNGIMTNYLSNLQASEIADINIQGKNVKISLDTNGWRWFRDLNVAMTTRLEGRNIEGFFKNIPEFLQKKTSNSGSLDFFVSRPLGSDVKEHISYYVGFTPGYATPDKQVVRDHSMDTIVADAYYPEETSRTHKAYSGKELDGIYADSEMDDDLFTKYMRLKGEAERLGFITSEKRAQPHDCEQFVCVHPWVMVKQEFIDFSKSMMQREETSEMAITCRKEDSHKDRKPKEYEFRARVFPKSYNVELTLVGSPNYASDIGGIVRDSMDLFGVRLSKDDKVNYWQYYKSESKVAEALANAGAKVGGAIAVPFVALGKGAKSAGSTIRSRYRHYQQMKQRKIEDIKQELRKEGIPSNIHRTGSCYIGFKKQCVLNKIEEKKQQEAMKARISVG
jgi:molybdopterin synthase catalytic subunit